MHSTTDIHWFNFRFEIILKGAAMHFLVHSFGGVCGLGSVINIELQLIVHNLKQLRKSIKGLTTGSKEQRVI